MNSRERFLHSMDFAAPDRAPLFEEGIREDVLAAWKTQGGPEDEAGLAARFRFDEREEIELDVDPHESLLRLANERDGLRRLERLLDPGDERRLPQGWRDHLPAWRERETPLMVEVHQGLFLSLGVENAATFVPAVYLLADRPDFVRRALEMIGEMTAGLLEKLLSQTSVDAAIFSEPVASSNGSLISPQMYERLVLPGYRPLLDVLQRHGVETIILRTYSNPCALLPAIFHNGFNCLWACECGSAAMDYRTLRKTLGEGLRLIGGIDVDTLYLDRRAIRQELETTLPPLLAQGGFIPLADGRVRGAVTYENYVYYRDVLEEIVARAA
jgi:hypothetical protein